MLINGNDFLIYADNAATTQLDKEALEAMLPYLKNQFFNPSSLYTPSCSVKKVIEAARHSISEAIGAEYDEIFFTSGGTESNNWAIRGSAYPNRQKGKNIIISDIEHHSVMNICGYLQKEGYKTTFLPVCKEGYVNLIRLNQLLEDKTMLVSIMLANNEIGTIQDLSAISDVLKDKNILFHTDAVQAVGHIPVDVKRLGVDLLSASAHKFNGPKGIGFLYVKKGVEIENLMYGGGQERKKRAGTENVSGIVGMAVALENNIKSLSENSNNLKELENYTLQLLNDHRLDFHLNGNLKNKIPGTLNISLRNCYGEALLHLFDLKGICISTGSACDSVEAQVSHVIAAINVPSEYRNGTLRFSYGKNNTMADVRKIVETLSWAVEKLKK